MTELSPRLIELREHRDDVRGALAVAEYPRQIPFVARRIFHLYDLPVNVNRGGHAHRVCDQFLICLHGALRVFCRFPTGEKTYELTSPRQGLYAPPLTWIDITTLQPGTICLVLTSDIYDPADYISDTSEYAALCAEARKSR